MRGTGSAIVLVGLLTLAAPRPAAAANGLGGAIGDLLGGVFALPMGVLAGTASGPPVIGTIGGALAGAINTLGYTTRGALKLVGVAVPTAASLAPYIPLFL